MEKRTLSVFKYVNYLSSYKKSEKTNELTDEHTDRQTDGHTENDGFIGSPNGRRGFKQRKFKTLTYWLVDIFVEILLK